MINHIKNILLLIIAAFVVTWLIWTRFIRERLPKDIPFELTEFRFYLLLYICFIYLIIIIFLMRDSNKSSIFANQIKIISDYIYTPLITLLDTKIKINFLTVSFIPSLLEHLFKKLNPFKTKLIYDDIGILSTFYIIFNVVPRLLLSSLLLLDIFYFKKIDLFYNFILIGIIPFIHRYGVYSLKNIHRLYEVMLEQRWSYIHLLGDEDYLNTDKNTLANENDNEEAIEIALKENFEFHRQKVTPKKYLEMIRDGTSTFYFEFPLVNEELLTYIQKINYPHLSINEMKNQKDYNKIYEENTDESLHFYHHKITYRIFSYISKTYSNVQNLWYVKSLRILAFSLYLFAWSYIFIISIYTLQEMPITLEILNKFSGLLYKAMNIFL